jgi:hypothetical protein
MMKLGEAVYKAQQSGEASPDATAGTDAPTGSAAESEVLDAQFEDVSDDEKK